MSNLAVILRPLYLCTRRCTIIILFLFFAINLAQCDLHNFGVRIPQFGLFIFRCSNNTYAKQICYFLCISLKNGDAFQCP